MIKDAEQFKMADKEYSARHEAKGDLEGYIAQVESSITSPEYGAKMKKGAKSVIETELAKAMEMLENDQSTADELKKCQLSLKRAYQKATSAGR
jgi:heat shock protein 1/8